MSPAGSCSSSWTGTSPLAAAAAAGVPLPLPSVTSSGSLGTAGVIAGTVGFAGDAVALELLQQQGSDAAAAAGGEGGEEAALADFSMLPEECWVDVLTRLGVKELCYCSRVSRWGCRVAVMIRLN